tara:strand:+ start:352 stop:588 length:237 start_codon:yes stop_codon:yes gene_type:complete
MSKIEDHEIIEMVSKNLKISKSEISLDSKQEDHPEWDSLANLRIYLELSKKLKKELPNEVIFQLNSIKSIIRTINDYS